MAKHFDENNNEIRCVYLAEFDSDNHCYIGTTNDYEDRIEQHLFTDRHSEVFQHKRHTGFIPKFILLHDYTSIEEADNLEKFHAVEYAKLGWKVLNVQKPGGYGHKETTSKLKTKIHGRINNFANPYNASEERYDNYEFYLPNKIKEFCEQVKKTYDILVLICKRAYHDEGKCIYIREIDIPYAFDYDELNAYIRRKNNRQLCNLSYTRYYGDNKALSYIMCNTINPRIDDFKLLCTDEDLIWLEEICKEIYSKCYVFKFTNILKKYYLDNLDLINSEATKLLLNHNTTAPFSMTIDVEQFGYNQDMVCSRADYATMLSNIGDLCSPDFNVNFDADWNVDCFRIVFAYNTYSHWAIGYDQYEMQEPSLHSKFSKLVAKIDNYINNEKCRIKNYPKRIEIRARDLNIEDTDTLRSFMRHFYVTHGTAWDTGSPDSCICSISSISNSNNLDDYMLNIDIQAEYFFTYYNLESHTLAIACDNYEND